MNIIESIQDARRLLEESSADTPSKPHAYMAAAFAVAMGLLLFGTVNAGPDLRPDRSDITRLP